jgi:four helix bundle protein
MKCYFDHAKLDLHQMAIEFVAWSECLLESCRGEASSAKQHLEEASASTPNNIAEGNEKWSKKDRKRFFEIARGSALVCASCLDILVGRQRVERPNIVAGKEKLRRGVIRFRGAEKSAGGVT